MPQPELVARVLVRARSSRADPLRSNTLEPPVHYEIRVNGVLDGRWATWFDGLHLAGDKRGQTIIAGEVADQAALHGLLDKIFDLGLELLEVRRTDQS